MSEVEFGKGPRRCHELAGIFGADTLDGLASLLENVARDLREEGTGPVVTGGSYAGGHYHHVVDRDMTNDAYFVAVDTYLAKLKNEKI